MSQYIYIYIYIFVGGNEKIIVLLYVRYFILLTSFIMRDITVKVFFFYHFA